MYIINYNTSQQNDRTNPVRIEYQRVQQSRTYSTSQVGKCWETVLRSSEYGKSQLNNTNEHPLSSMHKHIFFHLCGKKTKSRKARHVNDLNDLASASIVHRWGQVVEVVDMPRLGRRDVVEVVNMPLVFPLGSIFKSKVKVNPSHSWVGA